MRKIAYYKKRKGDIDWLTKQIRRLSRFEIDEAVIDEADDYKEYYQLLDKLEKKDTLIIYKLSVLELNRAEMLDFVVNLNAKDVRLIIEDDEIDTAEQMHTNFLSDCLIMIEAQSESFKYLTKRRLELAHENGIILGRPKISNEIVKTIRHYRENQKMSIRQIAEECNVSIGTVHKYVSHSKEVEMAAEKSRIAVLREK